MSSISTRFVFPSGEHKTTSQSDINVQLNHTVRYQDEVFRVYSIEHNLDKSFFERIVYLDIV